MDVPDVPRLVDEVIRRPVVVPECIPRAVVVVEGDRVAHPEAFDSGAHVAEIVLEGELGRVHAEDDEPLRSIALVPRLQVRERAEAVDAGVRPEVDQHDLAAQRMEAERPRIDPRGDVVDVGRGAVILQRHLPES